jgi:hypothetical protein
MMDTQQVEILGRNRLINELIAADLEVALPLRDRGVDLIAYADLGSQTAVFTGCPIQMKASSAQYFGVHRKYEKFANITLAYVWNLAQPEHAVTYALTFGEAYEIAESMGWTKTHSWEDGGYSTSNPSQKLVERLEPYRMSPQKWREKILALQGAAP